MPEFMRYEGARLCLEGLSCDCPYDHHEPTQDIYIGNNLIKRLPEYIEERELGQRCLVVCDQNTYEVAGRDVIKTLGGGGFAAKLCLLKREGELLSDESAVGEVLMSMDMATEFFVSVGSGTITDIVRIVAAHTERPFVCVGTAPSMDGYTSAIAPLIKRGAKIHLSAISPEIIVCDLSVMQTAPLAMAVSGVGDVLGKYIAKADWAISALVTGEAYCPVCAKIAIDAADRLISHIDDIRARTEEGMRVLIEALLLAGITVSIIGNTRAVASVEHNIVHLLEMKMLALGEKPAPHGTSVGVATLAIWPIFERFRALDPDAFDADRAVEHLMDREERTRYMIKHYGEEAAEAIMRENEEDFLTPAKLKRRLDAIIANFPAIREELSKLPPYATVASAWKRLTDIDKPADISVSDALFDEVLFCAKDYRSRYTLFKTIDEIGLDVRTLL